MVERFHFSIKQKLQILSELDETNDPRCYIEKNITKKQIQDWRDKALVMGRMSEDDQASIYTLHSGPKRKYDGLYTYLYQVVKKMRAEKQAVTYNMLIEIACQELPEVYSRTYNGKRSLIDRFMKFHNLSLKTITSYEASTQDQLSQEEAQGIQQFRQKFSQIVTQHHIYKHNIYNMDQSAIYYEVPPKKTIDIKGSKQSTLQTKGLTKKRVTVISLISCNGEAGKQFVIFKGSNEGRVEQSLQSYCDMSNSFSCQENAWTDGEQLEKWLIQVWWPIAQRTHHPKLLVLDSYGPHLERVTDFQKYNTHILFVPKGFTWCLQPLDTIFHKTYKQFTQDYFVRNQRTTLKTEEEKRNFMVRCVKECLARVEKETIEKSWINAGLEYPLNIEDQISIENHDSMLVEQEITNNSLIPISDIMDDHLDSRMLEELPDEREQDVNRMIIEEENFFNL